MYATIRLVISRTNTLFPPYGPKTWCKTASGKDQGMWLTVTRRIPPMEAMGINRFGGEIWGKFWGSRIEGSDNQLSRTLTTNHCYQGNLIQYLENQREFRPEIARIREGKQEQQEGQVRTEDSRRKTTLVGSGSMPSPEAALDFIPSAPVQRRPWSSSCSLVWKPIHRSCSPAWKPIHRPCT